MSTKSPARDAKRAPADKSSANQLIAALPRADRNRLLAACKPVDLTLGDVLHQPGTRIRHAYFPTASFISDITPINGDSGLEVGLVGSEGMCGIALTLGVDTSAHQSLVQGAGPALRIGTAAFRRERAQSPAMRHLLERYAFVLMTQLAQAAVCISSHVVEQRLARWLLMSHDRAHADIFDVTHAFLAKMLAVRRVGVTTAAGTLQKRKLIRYARGRMEIVNRRGLEAAACACYRIDRATYQRHLGQ